MERINAVRVKLADVILKMKRVRKGHGILSGWTIFMASMSGSMMQCSTGFLAVVPIGLFAVNIGLRTWEGRGTHSS